MAVGTPAGGDVDAIEFGDGMLAPSALASNIAICCTCIGQGKGWAMEVPHEQLDMGLAGRMLAASAVASSIAHAAPAIVRARGWQ